jgi:hypothetical protein
MSQPKTYQSLANEYRALVSKSREQQGEELKETIARLTEIEQQLHKADKAMPRRTGGSTNYKITLSEKMFEEIEIHRLTCKLIMKSWWASWLPFACMHSLAAKYYAHKAERLYNNQKDAAELKELQSRSGGTGIRQ